MRRHHAVDQQRTVFALNDIGLFAFCVGQVTGNGFEEIGLGNDPVEAAILVNDDSETDRRFLELFEDPEDRCRSCTTTGSEATKKPFAATSSSTASSPIRSNILPTELDMVSSRAAGMAAAC